MDERIRLGKAQYTTKDSESPEVDSMEDQTAPVGVIIVFSSYSSTFTSSSNSSILNPQAHHFSPKIICKNSYLVRHSTSVINDVTGAQKLVKVY